MPASRLTAVEKEVDGQVKVTDTAAAEDPDEAAPQPSPEPVAANRPPAETARTLSLWVCLVSFSLAVGALVDLLLGLSTVAFQVHQDTNPNWAGPFVPFAAAMVPISVLLLNWAGIALCGFLEKPGNRRGSKQAIRTVWGVVGIGVLLAILFAWLYRGPLQTIVNYQWLVVPPFLIAGVLSYFGVRLWFGAAAERAYHSADVDDKWDNPEIQGNIDLKFYVDAMGLAGNRVRGSIYVLGILTAVLFFVTLDSVGLNWNDARLFQAQVAAAAAGQISVSPTAKLPSPRYQTRAQTYSDHIIGAHYVPTKPAPYAPARSASAGDYTYSQLARDLTAHEIAGLQYSIPILGVQIDNNSVGIFAGVFLIVALIIFSLHLHNAILQTRACVNAASRYQSLGSPESRSKAANEALALTNRAAVFTGVHIRWRWKLLIMLLSMIPFFAFGFYIYVDLIAIWTVFVLLGQTGGLVYFVIEIAILIAIGWLVKRNALLLLILTNCVKIDGSRLYDPSGVAFAPANENGRPADLAVAPSAQ